MQKADEKETLVRPSSLHECFGRCIFKKTK